MTIILGANGHVGSETAKALLKKGQQVTVLLHSDKGQEEWKQRGAEVAIVDINDAKALRGVFSKGERAFLLNPPGDPSVDNESLERKSVKSILKALDGSGMKKVVAESTYGAQSGKGIGDLGVLFELEKGLAKLQIPTTVLRAAYYMSNWDMSLETARKEGILYTFYPIYFKLPMVSPRDLGHFAARFLMEPLDSTGLQYVEGPQEYSSVDVAAAFSVVLNKPVKAVEIPESDWQTTMKGIGFSEASAKSMAGMTKITLERKYERPSSPHRGILSLQEYLKNLVQNV